MQQGLLNTWHIRDLLVFGQLQDEPVRGDGQLAKQRARVAIHQAIIEQATWCDVQE